MSKWTQKGEAPYGFELDSEGTVFKSYVEQAILKFIQENKSKLSLSNLAKGLNLKGFETRNGKPWDRHSIRRALKSLEKGKDFQSSARFSSSG